MILLLSAADDRHTDVVEAHLARRGARWVRFDHGDFPARARLSVELAPGAPPRRRLHDGARVVDLDDLRVAYHRRPRPPRACEAVRDELMRGYVATEAQIFVEDLWTSLDCAWLPALHAVQRRADGKLVQLEAAARVGFEIPPTLVTNDPDAFVDFHERQRGQLISKLAGPGLYRQPTHAAVRYTQPVTRADLGHAASVRYAPVSFQRRVRKSLEVRATVVGERVLAVGIHSQKNRRTAADWRRYDDDHTPHEAHALPADVEARCVQLTRALGLAYGAIDLIVDEDGRYVFLEINPNGQYLWLEELTGLPISETIADWLIVEDAR